ncbi:MAG: lipoprotein-anchoring transpeptidase ErfK/SrfK [Verrucomicrobiales bacterium]|jgi:lipoprotein-anchoring transpeptidase ErfK/SrfK
MKLRIYLVALSSVIVVCLSGCASKVAPVTATGYLEGISVASAQVSPAQNPLESEAHWDGDGISGSARIVIDLSDQQATFFKGDQLLGVSPISSGTASHPTPIGRFKVTQKNPNHRSSCYGDYVDSAGNVVVKDIDNRKDKRPPGTRYLGADMGYFMRFNGPIGMHRGFLPGYPASHGCIRLPEHMAEIYFENASLGAPVIVVP